MLDDYKRVEEDKGVKRQLGALPSVMVMCMHNLNLLAYSAIRNISPAATCNSSVLSIESVFSCVLAIRVSMASSSSSSAAAALSSASMATLPPYVSCARAASLQCGPLSPSLPVLLHRGRTLCSLSHMSGSSLLTAGSSRHSIGLVRATTSSEESGVPDASQQLQELFDDLKAKYDALENKSQVWIYGGGALLALWLSSAIVGAVNNIPLLPKVLEFVGLCYSGWFVYRYLLFKSSRKQLAADIQELKLKITGVPRSAFMTEDDE